jgi:L-lactate dehydrogenase complex protein LldF
MKAAAAAFGTPRRLAAAQRAARIGGRLVARNGTIGSVPGPMHGWTDTRDTPQPPAETFRTWWRNNREQS